MTTNLQFKVYITTVNFTLPNLGENMLLRFVNSFAFGYYFNVVCESGYSLAGKFQITCGIKRNFSATKAARTIGTQCELTF